MITICRRTVKVAILATLSALFLFDSGIKADSNNKGEPFLADNWLYRPSGFGAVLWDGLLPKTQKVEGGITELLIEGVSSEQLKTFGLQQKYILSETNPFNIGFLLDSVVDAYEAIPAMTFRLGTTKADRAFRGPVNRPIDDDLRGLKGIYPFLEFDIPLGNTGVSSPINEALIAANLRERKWFFPSKGVSFVEPASFKKLTTSYNEPLKWTFRSSTSGKIEAASLETLGCTLTKSEVTTHEAEYRSPSQPLPNYSFIATPTTRVPVVLQIAPNSQDNYGVNRLAVDIVYHCAERSAIALKLRIRSIKQLVETSVAEALEKANATPPIPDSDGDGVPNDRDRCASTPGNEKNVDVFGCSHDEFCKSFGTNRLACNRADFKFDELTQPFPRDCKISRLMQGGALGSVLGPRLIRPMSARSIICLPAH